METLCNVRVARTGGEEDYQLWHKCVQKGLAVPDVSGILGQIFFSVIKKNWWHRWHTLFLSYYRWYKRIIVCQGPWHTVAQSNKLYLPTLFSKCTRRARLFLFFIKLFCPKISLYSIRSI